MVLQRDIPVPVWGWAEAGETVTVEMAGVSAQGRAGADGAWRVTLPSLAAGGPHTLLARAASGCATVMDVLLGEVWICSGQSNMQFGVGEGQQATEEVAAATDARIRLFTVPNLTAFAPQTEIRSRWAVCSPETVRAFSAVGYFFGRSLRQAADVPIGLINTSWGGTVAEAWTSAEALRAEPELAGLLQQCDGSDDPEGFLVKIDDAQFAWARQESLTMPDTPAETAPWAATDCDDTSWETMTLPVIWQDAGVPGNGVLWFRRAVELPASWAGKALTLRLGRADKSDITFFNGVEVGHLFQQEVTNSWAVPRRYSVPGALAQAGRNVIAVRVFSQYYDGGLRGPAGDMWLEAEGEKPIALAGDWRYRIECDYGCFRTPPPGLSVQNIPTTLYNAMIAPLIPYAIRGAIWYQGESNADRPRQYRTLFPTMIQDWRQRWGQGDFPFYFVQLANFMASYDQPTESQWAELREAQTMTLSLPKTGMAVIIDIGEAEDIHPRNKQDVGARLARWAQVDVYGQSIEPSGPLFHDATVEGNAIRLRFTHAGGGLVAKDGPLTGLAIAGADRNFVWAQACIEGDTLLACHPDIPAPVAARYAWADNPVCNLYNAEGLPASPFRTDAWAATDALAAAEPAEAGVGV